MGNLIQSRQSILINTLTVGDFGVFTDSVSGFRVLMFKKLGINLPWGGATGNSWVKSCTTPGGVKRTYLTLANECPCDDCDYEYGIGITKIVKDPGVRTGLLPVEKWYGDSISQPTCTGGSLDDIHLLAAETAIIREITRDTGIGEGAIVDAGRCYIFSDDDITDASSLTITIYNDDDVATIYAIAFGGAHDTIDDAQDINGTATLTGLVQAYAISASRVEIVSINGTIFTVTAGTDTTVVSRELVLTSEDANEQFTVRYDVDFATQRKGWLWIFDSYTTAGTTTFTTNGTAHGATNDNADSDTYVDQMNAIAAWVAAGGWATPEIAGGTADVYIYGSDAIDTMSVAFSATSTTVFKTATLRISGNGIYPYLVADDVAREFSIKSWQDGTYAETSIEGATYCKYTFKITDTVAYNLTGASHLDSMVRFVDLYINQAYETTDLWDATNLMHDASDAGFAVDQTFDEILDTWDT